MKQRKRHSFFLYSCDCYLIFHGGALRSSSSSEGQTVRRAPWAWRLRQVSSGLSSRVWYNTVVCSSRKHSCSSRVRRLPRRARFFFPRYSGQGGWAFRAPSWILWWAPSLSGDRCRRRVRDPEEARSWFLEARWSHGQSFGDDAGSLCPKNEFLQRSSTQ